MSSKSNVTKIQMRCKDIHSYHIVEIKFLFPQGEKAWKHSGERYRDEDKSVEFCFLSYYRPIEIGLLGKTANFHHLSCNKATQFCFLSFWFFFYQVAVHSVILFACPPESYIFRTYFLRFLIYRKGLQFVFCGTVEQNKSLKGLKQPFCQMATNLPYMHHCVKQIWSLCLKIDCNLVC